MEEKFQKELLDSFIFFAVLLCSQTSLKLAILPAFAPKCEIMGVCHYS
jgi:hypothetical protein